MTDSFNRLNKVRLNSILEEFAKWESAETRACDCGSFNVERARCAPYGVMVAAFRCVDCGTRWNEN